MAEDVVGEEIFLTKPVHGGAALGRLPDGRTVFVRGGIPGETVRVQLTSEHKKFAWAKVVEVVEASPERVPHSWPEAQEGGFELGHVSPAFQREWKTAVLTEQLRRIGVPLVVAQIQESSGELDAGPGEEDSPLVPVLAAPGDEDDDLLLNRRTRLQLVIDKRGRPGLRKYRSHQILDLEDLPYADEEIENLRVLDDPKWRKTWTPGERIAVEAPNASDALVVTGTGAYKSPDTRVEGPSFWSVSARGKEHKFAVRPGAFWQTHRQAPAVLVEAVLEGAALEPTSVVAELYSGSGLFSRFIADEIPDGELVTLEGDASAVESAGQALLDEALDGRVQLFEGGVDPQSVAELFAAATRPVSTVILDPPRSGAGKDVIRAIAHSSATRVVLVSCDPAAGARDLADLVKGGFTVESVKAWDLFPHTHHFEIVSVLQR